MSRPALILHINYYEQGQSLETACRDAVKLGFDGIEFRRKRAGKDETQEQYLDEIEAAVSKSGLKQVVFGSPGPDLTGGDAAHRDSEIEAARDFYTHVQKRFGTTICNTFGGSLLNPDPQIPYNEYTKQGSGIATDEQWQWAIEGFKSLAKTMEEIGLKLAFETHMGYIHDTPEGVKKLVDEVGSSQIGALLDCGNIALFPNSPSVSSQVELLGERIFYLHLKNLFVFAHGGYVCTSLADGHINNRELLKTLKAMNFSGPICIEAPRAGDREWFAREDMNYLQSLLNDLEWN
jgi:sugar phosphate isomerase/epimerase